jgi:hypothetical protein
LLREKELAKLKLLEEKKFAKEFREKQKFERELKRKEDKE